jgi:F-type H+-transporting ATPase subunit b
MLQLEPGMIIWTWATFLVLLAVLYKVAWKPLVKIIEDRESAIEENLISAQQDRENAEKLLKDQEDKLKKTHEEVKAILEDSRQLAEKTKNEIIVQAKSDAEKLVNRGKADIEREKLDALNSLKKEISSMVIKASSKILGETLDEKKHQNIIEQSIKELGKN